MKRSALLSGLMMILVLAHWIFSFYFFKRLPPKMMIPTGDSILLLERILFFAFPALTSLVAVLTLLTARSKHLLPFWGKSRVKGLPKEFANPVYDRSYQVVVMTVLFVSMVLIYIQFNVALFSTEEATRFDIGAALAVSPIILIYLGFNQYVLKRMAESSRQVWKDSQKADLEKPGSVTRD